VTESLLITHYSYLYQQYLLPF